LRDPEQMSGGLVAAHRRLAAGEQRGHQVARGRGRHVADGVEAVVHAPQEPVGERIRPRRCASLVDVESSAHMA
jgi:hypothetical protein